MRQVDREIDRYLALLRRKITERGFTQLEVQKALGWGRSYISQILNRNKALRVEQLLLIFNVIGVDPAAFFGELHDLEAPPGPAPRPTGLPAPAGKTESLRREIEQAEELLQALIKLLLKKQIITARDLMASEQEAMASGEVR